MTQPNPNAQPVRMVPDQGGGYTFVLNHVYAPGQANGRHDTIAALDQPASYWSVTETRTNSRKSLTFETARSQSSKTLTFERFSAVNHMRDDLLALFG